MAFMNGFTPYFGGYPAPTPAPMPTPAAVNTLPQQQVLQANGKQSIDALRLAPNSSVLIMDTTAPLVWLCTSDSLGAVTAKPYDITPHEDAPAVDVSTIEQRLSAIEKKVEELKNEQSDAWRGEHDAPVRHDASTRAAEKRNASGKGGE